MKRRSSQLTLRARDSMIIPAAFLPRRRRPARIALARRDTEGISAEPTAKILEDT